MNTIKKTIIIGMAALAAIALITSCSKEPGANAKVKEPKTSKTVKSDNISPDEKNFLNAVRSGQYVALDWHFDVTGNKIKQFYISRNSTGVGNKTRIASLNPDATNYKDCLPDGNAYWYWVRINTVDGKSLEIGPVRVPSDTAGASSYTKLEDKYNVTITRTDELATLKWNFPEDGHKTINIVRFPKLVTEFKGAKGVKGVAVLTTVEGQSKCTDALPDANSDYWYWFRITMDSGAIIYKGPIKAEYAGQ